MVLVHGTLYVRAAFIDGQSRDGVSMVFAHTNSMGVTYFLNQKTVDLRGRSTQSIYYFSKDRRPETIERLPEGFSVNENPRSGFLSVRRTDGRLVSQTPYSAQETSIGVVTTDFEGERGLLPLSDTVIDASGERSVIEFQPLVLGSSLSRAIDLLRSLVTDPEVPEKEFQVLLEEVPELIPGDYLEVRPHIRLESADASLIPDFVLRPVSGFWDVLELKLPRVKLLVTGPGARVRFSAQVSNALQQLRSYAQALEDPLVRERLWNRHQIEMYKPSLRLIIGTSSELRRFDLQLARTTQAPDVTVHTWDDVIAIGESRLRRSIQ